MVGFIYSQDESNSIDIFPEDSLTLTLLGCSFLPEWDILQQVLNMREKVKLNLEWIKVHEDDKTLFHKLQFGPQLNVLSNKEDTTQQIKLLEAIELDRVPKLPWVPVQLLRGKKTITSRYERYILRSFSTDPLMEKIQICNN